MDQVLFSCLYRKVFCTLGKLRAFLYVWKRLLFLFPSTDLVRGHVLTEREKERCQMKIQLFSPQLVLRVVGERIVATIVLV